MPRVYRGRDVMWWLTMAGVLDERYDEIDDLVRGRNVASPQLVGTPHRATLDLNALTRHGVALVGRLWDPTGPSRGRCATCRCGSLRPVARPFDEWALGSGVDGDVDPPHRLEPTASTSSCGSRWIPPGNRNDRVGDGFPTRLPWP
jgi:putative flavoprotein involved in K+ transport